MHATRALPKLYEMGSARLSRLRLLFGYGHFPIDAARDRTIAYICVEAMNLWASFVRCYYLSCMCRAKMISGANVTSVIAFGSPQEAIDYAVIHLKRKNPAAAPFSRRDEPVWHDWSTLPKLSIALNLSVDPAIRAATGYSTTMNRFLPVFRNFYAHRNDDTFRKTQTAARQLGIPGGRQWPSQLLSTPTAGAVQPILVDWLDDIQNLMDLLCH
jgi:hypothetical protein